jgi:hypothetical protein
LLYQYVPIVLLTSTLMFETGIVESWILQLSLTSRLNQTNF